MLRTALDRLEASKWWRIIGVICVSLSLLLMVRIFVLNFVQFKNVHVKFDLVSLFIGMLLNYIVVWIGTFSWGEVISALNPEVAHRDAIKYHLASIATKYLPGLGWQQISKVVQLYRGGVPGIQLWQSVATELVLVILIGISLAVQLVINTYKAYLGSTMAQFPQEILVGLLWLCCAAVPIIIYRFSIRKRMVQLKAKLFLFHLYFAGLLDILGWLIQGLSLWYTVRGFSPLLISDIPYCTIAIILSLIVGLAIIIVPNGIGVRELVLLTFLQAILPISLCFIVAFVYRIVTVLGEFMGVLPVITYIFKFKAKETRQV